MKFYNPFRDLTVFERCLWLLSCATIIISYTFTHGGNILSLIASLIGVTSLIFLAKGYVIGQALMVVFSVFYGVISFFFRYYGEMATYLLMTAPMAVLAIISWLKNPHNGTREVEVNKPKKKQILFMFFLSIITTVIFYFILKSLNNANLFFSTLSVTTSFFAAYLTYLRSPYYALAYASNDIVLIILWTLATFTDTSYLPMVVCFSIFFFNDMYAFYNWRKIKKRQEKER